MTALAPALRHRLAAGEPTVLVTVVEAHGSTPREAGARMLVTACGTAGTIGGGRLEWEALARARALIAAGEARARLDLPLGPALGQCCGGRVALDFERAGMPTLARLEDEEAAAAATLARIHVFGAGHVGKALVRALAPLPFGIVWADPRPEEFAQERWDGVEIRVTASLGDVVAEAPAGAAFVVLTHSHALDFEVAEAALRRADAAYVGMIGSATKRERFQRWFRARGNDARLLTRFVCPIGTGLGRDKRPAVIAAMTARELLVALAASSRSDTQEENVPAPAETRSSREEPWSSTREPALPASSCAA
ncbi:xanthine dehydrogenase accessory protein XdhC [Chelatococcus sp. SYSU_G07232]|uniref:Xanthine dehydrogenase accessory protein XdhC n=1 Tax=Chelatococcus albus TaxID=3047466 RepID=A0ABT7ACG1_9HYPH|nr:xanthine dehydrogenase accessory protein XdhC [Chelatococcus sp. SYSU_G07232]MDJ1157056.1 xanthine dehydrogenase accessory protein XdhC [Chelatococcus sp. SYSU_G07232]